MRYFLYLQFIVHFEENKVPGRIKQKLISTVDNDADDIEAKKIIPCYFIVGRRQSLLYSAIGVVYVCCSILLSCTGEVGLIQILEGGHFNFTSATCLVKIFFHILRIDDLIGVTLG